MQQVIEHLAPAEGVELVNVTDEDEYFPPPRELRELLPRLVALADRTLRPRHRAGTEDAPRRPLRRRVSTVLADLSP